MNEEFHYGAVMALARELRRAGVIDAHDYRAIVTKTRAIHAPKISVLIEDYNAYNA
ncbi:MAG: hypothetical protein LBJ11_00020 [Oscillospiraceae bacterium]|jgi:hypothetical protein|nr:hypothetical protein [Oscillospiraceae bacterium]